MPKKNFQGKKKNFLKKKFFQRPFDNILIPGSTHKKWKLTKKLDCGFDPNISESARYPYFPTEKWQNRKKRLKKEEEIFEVEKIDDWEKSVLEPFKDGSDMIPLRMRKEFIEKKKNMPKGWGELIA